jgi:uncharacterized protein (DUF885 family)
MSPINDAHKPRIPDAIDKQRLQAMQLVAKMKESADKYGVGFVGGFVSPDGQKFMMTMDEADTNALLPEDVKQIIYKEIIEINGEVHTVTHYSEFNDLNNDFILGPSNSLTTSLMTLLTHND